MRTAGLFKRKNRTRSEKCNHRRAESTHSPMRAAREKSRELPKPVGAPFSSKTFSVTSTLKEQIGYIRPSTVRMARLMALGSCTSSDLANLAAATEWKPLRTMDAREAGAHYYQWLKHMRPNTQRLVVARWIRTTQVEWLPGQARDIYLRRLHSAVRRKLPPETIFFGWLIITPPPLGWGGVN